MNTPLIFTRFQRFPLACAAALLLTVGTPGLRAQVINDDFDDGNISEWQVRNVVQPLGGFVANEFPTHQGGRALRLIRGSADMTPLGQAQDYGTGRAWLFRTNVYTDFYVAADLVTWDNNTNQAMVLLARASGYDKTLGPGFPPGLGTVSGYVCNYDNAQAGDGPTSRRGGQFQINLVENEGTRTLSAADITLKPGKIYRMVFKGVGSRFTGQVYDYEDLTRPLITVEAEDSTFQSGTCGLVTYHRAGRVHPNMSDMTVDNYYSAPGDPNTAIAPAIAHSNTGTPQVITRSPAARFANFHPASSGISFTARTFTTNLIDLAATRLYLNGADRSSALVTPTTPPSAEQVTYTTANGTLSSNTVYEARIELSDVTGTLKSTNVFWFDTFTQASLAGLLTIEAEDYNYEGGKFQLSPIPLSGYDTNGVGVNGSGVGYLDQVGVAGIDYSDARTSTENGWNDYRAFDAPGTLQGNREDISDLNHPAPTSPPWNDPARPNDTTRDAYAARGMKEYQVARTQAGEWLNYTRVFPDGRYRVYIRAGSFGDQNVTLSRVEGDTSSTNQTATELGVFQIPNQFMRMNYLYTPLMNGGAPAVVQVSGTNTLRLTIQGTPGRDDRLLSLNYLVFVPAPPDATQTQYDPFTDGNDSAAPAWSRYNPIGTGSWSFPGGSAYRLQTAPSPDPGLMLQGRAGSLAPGTYGDFFVSADVTAWDHSVQQIFGVMARVQNAGLATTTGYMFTHDRGNPSSTNSGDMDIVRLDGEFPTVLENTSGTDSIHFSTNKQYRIVFIGRGTNFIGRVYELPNTTTPVVEVTATDTTYSSGSVGLLVANNTSPTFDGPGDATFDNFFASTEEPRLNVAFAQNTLVLSWAKAPFRLQRASASGAANWTAVDSGIVEEGQRYVFRVANPQGAQMYRLVYP